MAGQSNKQVLVVGGDVVGSAAANAIAASGYKVALAKSAGETAPVKVDENIEVLEGTVARVNGFCGGFDVCVTVDGKESTKAVDAIVVATPISEGEKIVPAGLEGSAAVLSQTELAEKLSDIGDKTVVFLYGLENESNPVAMVETIDIVEKTYQAGAQVYMFSDNLKVAEGNLDSRLAGLRDAKCVLVKSAGALVFTPNGSDIEVSYTDATLRMPVTINADYIVVDPMYAANKDNGRLAEALNIKTGPNQFLQTDNVYNISVMTTKTGVFAVGPAKGVRSEAAAIEDVNNVVMELDKLFSQALDENRPYAVVEPDKCVICLTCYRSCQHGAISWKDSAAVVDPDSCQACGMCAAECPMNAIQVKGYTDEEIDIQIKTVAAKEMVAFCCKNSAVQAFEAAKEMDTSVADNLKVIEIPCAGKIDTEQIMSAFQSGAEGVMVIGCHTGNCKSEKGNLFAKRRVAELDKLLQTAGIPENKLVFKTVASNMGVAIINMMNQIKSV